MLLYDDLINSCGKVLSVVLSSLPVRTAPTYFSSPSESIEWSSLCSLVSDVVCLDGSSDLALVASLVSDDLSLECLWCFLLLDLSNDRSPLQADQLFNSSKILPQIQPTPTRSSDEEEPNITQ